MSTKKFLVLLGVLVLTGVVLAACGGAVPAVTEPPATATQAAVAATAPPAAATELPVAAVPAQHVALQFETCAGCHRDAGEEHQGSYNRLYQDGVIQVTGVTYKFAAAAGDKTD